MNHIQLAGVDDVRWKKPKSLPEPIKTVTPRPARPLLPGDSVWPEKSSSETSEELTPSSRFGQEIPAKLDEAVRRLKSGIAASSDVIVRELVLSDEGPRAAVVFVDGLVDKKRIDEYIIGALRQADRYGLSGAKPGVDLSSVTAILERVLSVSETKEINQFSEVEAGVLTGDTVLLLDGSSTALDLGTKGWDKRSVSEPQTERTIRGPREGFVETLSTNVALVRREIASPDLRVEYIKVGVRAKRTVALMYMKGITNPAIVETARKRLAAIDVDAILSDYAVEYYLQDHFLTPFPLARSTERPDFTAREVLNGKLAILTDGSPFSVLFPTVLTDFFRTTDDYTGSYTVVTLTRFVRLLANFITFFLAPGYIALIDVHPDLLPTDLAVSIAGSREGVPFPAIIEVFLMVIAFEILREGTVRLPGMMGQTIGIVGGLVIGQAAVQAKIVSDIMVIIIALTAIASFTNADYQIAATWRLLLPFLLVVAALFGIYGIALFALLIIAHITSLTSFGVPYTATVSPVYPGGYLDNFIQAPLGMLRTRLLFTRPLDKKKQKPYRQPMEHPDLAAAQKRAERRRGDGQ